MDTALHSKPNRGGKIDQALVMRSGVIDDLCVAWVVERIPLSSWVRLRVFWHGAIYHYRSYRYKENAVNALNNVVFDLRKKEMS